MAANRLLIFDGNALLHRAYHALPPLKSPKGELVNAVYGFMSSLLAAINELNPRYVVVAFDVAGPTFRDTLYEQYKATRQPAPQEFYDQIPRVQELLKRIGVPVYGVTGYEADDILATVTKKAQKQKLEVIIATGDNDALQLVAPAVKVYSLARGERRAVLYDVPKVKEKYGIAPAQMVDLKALAGDPSDNIKGVPGIGLKGAVVLIKAYGPVENIVTASDRVAQLAKEVLLAKEIVKLRDDVPIELELPNARLTQFDWQAAKREFQKLGFKTLVKRLPVEKNHDGQQRLLDLR